MKVLEVLQKKPTHKGLIPIVRIPRDRTLSIEKLKQNFVGSGYQTDAFKHPKHGKTVIKLVHIPDDDYRVIEGAVWYVNAVLGNPNNPFFPRIHKAKIYESGGLVDREMDSVESDRDHYNDYTAIMFLETEVLIPVDHPNLAHSMDEMLEAVGITKEKLTPLMRMSAAQMHQHAKYVGGMTTAEVLGSIPANKFARVADTTNNPELAKAIHIMHEVVTSHPSADIDIKDDNFMVRITSVGPQLVLNDPIV